MNQSITIIDADYKQWLKELVMRYRNSQIKAALKVNTEQLFFNLSLGKDIAERQAENKYGSRFYAALSRDLKDEIPGVEGLSTQSFDGDSTDFRLDALDDLARRFACET